MTPHRHEARRSFKRPAGGAPTPDDIWLGSTWPFVRRWLPSAPVRVVEIGCGESGGHIPTLIKEGYDAVGVDPEAPDAEGYLRQTFESYSSEQPVYAVVASLSLHHMEDLPAVLTHVESVLRPGGRLVVVEWISEAFDDDTARWCFAQRLCDPEEPGAWLAKAQTMWTESGLPWSEFLRGWLEEHGLHPAATIQRELKGRFDTLFEDQAPYFYPDLLDVDAEAEQAAIDAGTIRAGCLRYAGCRKS
ncbi:MAG TPA: methyltransferase domain-containing protein [Chloroflexota bacterium]|nr:methyltransferase domain-containing protein [Chloroflexota bacterium]